MVRSAFFVAALLLLATIAAALPSVADGPTADAPLTPLATPPKPTGWGTHPTGFHNFTIPRPNGQPDVAARLQYPATSSGMDTPIDQTSGPWPMVIYFPGGGGPSYTVATSRLIASWGFVVLDVELSNTNGGPCCRNPQLMASEVPVVIDWLEDLDANASQQFDGMLDLDRLGVTGHSWGGLLAALALSDAYGDDRIHYGVPISATPAVAIDYTKDLVEPVYYLTGSAGDNDLQPLFDATPSPAAYTIVTGVDHGGMVGQTAYVVAFFLYWEQGLTDYQWWLYTQGIHDEDDAGTVTYQSKMCMPRIEVTPLQLEEDQSVSFRGWTEGLTWGSVSYEWDLDGVGGYDTLESSPNGTHTNTFEDMGTPTPKLRIVDDWESVILPIEINVTNVAPLAEAGGDQQAAEDAVVHLDGANSTDTPSDLLAGLLYAWDLGDGSTHAFDAAPTFAHAYDAAATYTITLSVKDNDGNVTTDTLSVTVVEGVPIVTVSTPPLGAMDSPVTLQGEASDTASDLLAGFTYVWDFGDGSALSPESELGNATHVYTGPGTFVATLVATDRDGAVGLSSTNVTIANVLPTAQVLSPHSGDKVLKDHPVTFEGRGSDTITDLQGLLYAWDFDDGQPLLYQPTVVTGHTFRQSGPASATLWVLDPQGESTSASVGFTVLDEAPVLLSVGPSKDVAIDEDTPLVLEVEATDTVSDLSSLTYAWDIQGAVISTLASDTLTFDHYINGDLSVVVTDQDGVSTSSTVHLLVRNPGPSVSFDHFASSGQVGQTFNFSVVGRDTASDRLLLTYVWDFDDGSNATGTNVSHVFSDARTFEVRVTVTDDEGASATEIVQIKVRAAPGGPGGPHLPRPDGDHNTTEQLPGLPLAGNLVLAAFGLIAVAAGVTLLLGLRRRNKPTLVLAPAPAPQAQGMIAPPIGPSVPPTPSGDGPSMPGAPPAAPAPVEPQGQSPPPMPPSAAPTPPPLVEAPPSSKDELAW